MTQIKLRRDTSAAFASSNPILGNGEPAYETDTKKLKIGDGTTAYTQLEYFSSGGGLEVKTASTADFNSSELLETGLYFISPGLNPQNGPSPYSGSSMLITMKWYADTTNQRIQQTWIGCEDLIANQIYTRYSKPDGVMNSWVRVDSNKIASASALGSIKVGDGLTISSDGTLSPQNRYPIEISDKSLIPSWYIVYNDGWCEQGGYAIIPPSASLTVQLLKPYKDVNYTRLLTLGDRTDRDTWAIYPSAPRTTSSFGTFTSISGYNTGFDWEAKGYIS